MGGGTAARHRGEVIAALHHGGPLPPAGPRGLGVLRGVLSEEPRAAAA